MKRFLFTVVLMALLVVFMDPAETLLSKFLRLEQPTVHEIQKGEWLSKVAQQFYGDASYWKELALINRAPDGDLIFPGEKVVIPSFDAIQKIRKSRRLSIVNELVDEQQSILAGKVELPKQPVGEIETIAPVSGPQELSSGAQVEDVNTAFQDEQNANSEKESSFVLSTPVVTGVVILALVLVVGIFMYSRQKKRQEVSFYGAPSEDQDDSKSKGNVYFDDFDEESSKGNSKSKEKELAVL